MRIPCPHCGERDAREFSCLGDAAPRRPELGDSDSNAALFDYIYLRSNPAGDHQEYWYHAAGCHSWLVVTRNTVSHEIHSVQRATEHGA